MSDVIRLAVVIGLLLCTMLGWAGGHVGGAFVGLLIGLMALVLPWRGQPLWRWAGHYARRNRPIALQEPVTVTNDRSGGGIRYQEGTAVAVIQVMGKRHRPTLLTGSAFTRTSNLIDADSVVPLLRHSLGLTIESVSVISTGARRRNTGDYSRVYDTLVGPAPYAGSRETWLVVRVRDIGNGEALRWRPTAGRAALAAAQRIASALRREGVRARVATATDIAELDRRLGVAALGPHGRRWHSLRGDAGWMTTYAYRPADISTEVLAQAWSQMADGVIHNVTIFPDGTCCASVTLQSPQPPTACPSVALRSLPGEQARALANNLAGPRRELHGQARSALPSFLQIPVGPSGILLGKVSGGDRLLLPLSDPAEPTRVHIAAEAAIVKRIVIRAAAAGERITVHTLDPDRWDSVRMPYVTVTDQPRPASGSTMSVTDGTVSPAPRPATVIEVGEPGTGRGLADITIVQTGSANLEVRTPGDVHDVEVEFFRAENRYVSGGPAEHAAATPVMAGRR